MDTLHDMNTPLTALTEAEIVDVWISEIGELPPITADKDILVAVLNECVDAQQGKAAIEG